MSLTMILRRILGCLLLILLSQHGDARNSRYFDIITSLQRIENMFAEQKSLNCLVPVETLFDMIKELSRNEMYNDSTEATNNRRAWAVGLGYNKMKIIRKALDLNNEAIEALPEKQRQKNSSRNKNLNTNVNTNINRNTNQFRARRTFEENAYPSKMNNRNVNSNYNVNSNSNLNKNSDLFDYSDEEVVEEV